jgi:hypothetical protein
MTSCQLLNDVFVGAGVFFFLMIALFYAYIQVKKEK